MNGDQATDHDPTSEIEISLLLEGIYLKYRSDFRRYSRGSVRRRLEAAMAHFRCGSISRLQDAVLSSPQAFDQLLQFLTVPTSDMFRDPSYFSAIREKVVPHLETYPSLKIWIAGCSTGEEVYSFAILLHEEGLLSRTLIYATDINPRALEQARAGTYALDRIPGFTASYQKAGGKGAFSDYYTTNISSATFAPFLGKSVVFADHSLATDSAFAEVQLVSCRNVLIYFDRGLQERAFELFHDALGLRGFLGLGSQESLRFTKCQSSFEAFAEADRIFRKANPGMRRDDRVASEGLVRGEGKRSGFEA